MCVRIIKEGELEKGQRGGGTKREVGDSSASKEVFYSTNKTVSQDCRESHTPRDKLIQEAQNMEREERGRHSKCMRLTEGGFT